MTNHIPRRFNMYRTYLVFFTFLFFFLSACTKVTKIPIPTTETGPTKDPTFSTLDFATTSNGFGRGLAINGSNLYVAGYTVGDLDGTSQSKSDGFLRRYNGGKLWGLQFGTRFSDHINKVATDSSGNVYVMGDTSGPFGFKVGEQDTFLAKFSRDSELLWTRQFGTKYSDSGIDLATDSNNRIYVLSDEGSNNFTIRKFRSDGKVTNCLCL